MVAGVIAAAWRAGSVLVVAESVVTVLAARRAGAFASGQLRRAAAGVVGMAVLFSAVVGIDVLVSRFRDADPYASRREFVESSVAMVRERPWFGFGLGNFE